MLEKFFAYSPMILLAAYLLWVGWSFYGREVLLELLRGSQGTTPVGKLRAPATAAEVKTDNLETRIREAEGYLHVAKQAQNVSAQASLKSLLKSYQRQLKDHQKVIKEKTVRESRVPAPPDCSAEEQIMKNASISGDQPRYKSIEELEAAIIEQERYALHSEHSGDADRVAIHRANAAALRKERDSRS